MKRVFTLSTLLLFFAIGFIACQKIEKDTPPAIKKLIRENKNRGGQVVEYEYNNENIYCWIDFCCDGYTSYYDKNAKLLWQTGGFDGKGSGVPLEGFYENAIYKRIIWTNKKTKEYLLEERKNKKI